MNPEASNEMGKSSTKTDGESKSNQVTVSTPNEEKLPDIFKLDVDCFEEVFDYLSLKDLVSVGQTCKRLHRVAGHFFQLNYGVAMACCEKNLSIRSIIVNCFVNFIEKLWIININFGYSDTEDEEDENYGHDKKSLGRLPFQDVADFFHTQLCNYKSLNLVEMTASGVSRKQFEGIKRFLDKVVSVKVWPNSLPLEEGFFQSFLKFCTNLKRLSVVLVTTDLIVDQNDWLFRNYPHLEHFELQMFTVHKIEAMEVFLQLNPNIRTFAIYGKILWTNRESFINIGHKLNVLATTFVENDFNPIEFHLFCIFLNVLHERGFYKRLHLYFPGACFKQSHASELVSLKGLVKLVIINPHASINLSALSDLEELFIGKSNFIADLKDLPDTLTNLKRIQFLTTSLDDILVFVTRANKLNKFKFNLIKNEISGECIDILDLSMLNEERAKLAGANKIMIYVSEKVYLATKWVMNQTNHSFIEMKRITSYDWRHEFDDASTEK